MEKKTHRLDLTEFIAPDAEITWKEGVLKIPADMPFALAADCGKFAALQDVEVGDKKALEELRSKMGDILKSILETRNDAAAVKKFIDALKGVNEFNRVFRFVFNFIVESGKEDESVKKKSASKTS